MTELLCPKCQAPMRSYERNGVTVDRCTECRGVFLDAGELERLMAAEAGVDREPAWAGAGHPPPRPHGDEHEHDHEHRYGPGTESHRRRRGGFLAELQGGDDD